MDSEELKTFIELANCRNFSKTAERMYVVQSTVSNRIKALEEYIGETLVIRDKSGIRFTKEGELFLTYAKRIYEMEQTALTEINMLSAFEDRLDVGCVQWIYNYEVAQRIAVYSNKYPTIASNLIIAHGEEIIPMLQQQKIDVGFLPYAIDTGELASILLERSRIVLVGEATRFGKYAQGITKEMLPELPLIYSDIWQNCLADISGDTLTECKTFNVRCNMLDSAKEFCLSGAGVCFLPKKVVEKELWEHQLTEVPLLDLPEKYVDIYMVYSRNRESSIALRHWLEMFR